MTLGGRISKILNYKLTLKPETRISRNKAIIILLLTAVVLIAAGLGLGKFFFAPNKTSYYENRTTELNDIFRDSPEDRAARVELALTTYLKGEADKGIRIARGVLEQYPDDREALFNLGLMLSDRGKNREAADVLGRIFKLYPRFNDSRARFYLGKSCYESGDYRKALVNLQLAVQMDQGSPVDYYYLGRTEDKLGNT